MHTTWEWVIERYKKKARQEDTRLDEKSLENFISNEKKKNVRTLLEKQFNHEELKWEPLSQLDFFF